MPKRRDPGLGHTVFDSSYDPRAQIFRVWLHAPGGGNPPKIDQTTEKLLGEDVKERPVATIVERRRFLKHMTGKAMSDSTVGRLLRRMGFSPKNGVWGRWSEMNG